ncbi:MAG: family 10 glycosylhydrolase [Candidatus Brocadiae bacterium]|nr:family 10 glycosylhydrolase [Candidatus Brocadiia bacterium]
MKGVIAASLVLALCAPLCGGQAVTELRGAWLHGRECKDRDATNGLLDRAETLNLNSLFVLVFAHRGHAVYRSEMVPMLDGIEEGFDPLGHLVEEGHRRGIQVHAWFVNGSYGWGRQKGILDERPEWRAMDLRGERTDWYDLCHPEVREWQTRLMCEVLERYDVDGVHFDYIRFNDRSVCTCPSCRRNAMAEAGLDIGALTYAELPAYGALSGNPLAEPTTAEVLAEFDDGVPAIALNRVGAGQVMLLNWHVRRWCPSVVVTAIQRGLSSAGVGQGDRVFLLDSDVNAPRYGRNYWRDRPWVESLGYRVEKTTDDGIAQLPPGSPVVLIGFYMMNEGIAAALLRHVEAGGSALFIDGPVFAMEHPSAQALLGFERMGKYFNGERALLTTGAAPQIVPSSDRPFSMAAQAARHALWDEWRKEQVTRLVAAVYERAWDIRPDALVTAAVFYHEGGSEGVLQDWPRWHREGICDYLIPMSYVKTPEELEKAFAWWKGIDPDLARIIPAVGAWNIAKGSPPAERAEQIRRQVEVCRRQGARGVVMFVLNEIDDDLAAILGPAAFPGKAVPYRPGAAADAQGKEGAG